VTQASGEIEKLATADAETKTVEVKRHPITEMLFMRTPEFIASAVLLSILLYFQLVYDQVFIAKLVKLLPTLSDKKTAVGIAHDIESQISHYLFAITAINACLIGRRNRSGPARSAQPGNVGCDGRAAQFRPLPGRSHRHYLHDHRRHLELR